MFTAMKPEVDSMLAKYGTDTPPPPAQLFTVPDHPGTGNIHFVQHVFEGAFEFDILFESGSTSEPVTCEFDKLWYFASHLTYYSRDAIRED